MKARFFIVFLLALAMLPMIMAASASASANSRVDEEEESKLTPKEEREVRALASRFDKRWREGDGFKQIIGEMFVKDFSERLWRAPTNELPWWLLDENLLAYSGGDELRRYYVASMNFSGLYFRLGGIIEHLKKLSETDGQRRETEVFSPEIMKVLLSDATLAELLHGFREEDENERAKEVENNQPAESVDSPQAASAASPANGDDGAKESSEEGIIKSPTQLSGLTTTLEKANELMRQRLASMPPIPPEPLSDDQTKPLKNSLDIFKTTLDEGQYNYAKGTPVVRLASLPFTLTLIKIDGHFKILTIAVYVD